MRGGWRGAMSTVGGLTRTYGLQRHFTKEGVDGPPPRIDRTSLQRVSRYFRPYARQWLVVLICIGLTAGLNVLPPFCVGTILDRAIPDADMTLLALLAGAMVGLALVSGLIGVLQQSLTAKAGQSIMFDLRNELFRHLQQMSLHFYTATRSGEIVSRINNDVNAVQGVATGTLVAVASNVATLTATSIALFSMNWRLTIVAVLVVPAFYLPSRLVGAIRRRLADDTQESQASLLAFMQERLHVSGSILTKIFGQQEPDAGIFAEQSARVRDLNVKQAIVGRWLFMILSVFSAMGPALIFWYGGYQVIREQLTPGLLVAFAALLTLLYRPLVQLASVYVDVQAAIAVFDRILEYLDLRPSVKEKPDALALAHTEGHIAFEGVRFAYPAVVTTGEPPNDGDPDEPATEPFALQDVSFEIAPGEQVALVGPSGAGKTTITYLVPRFYDPDAGRITLDGHDLRDLAQESIRQHIGVVTQETFLFHSTIRENLLYARPDALESEMIEACQTANIHDFVSALPDGYGTVVGERGFRLSGGEKQRVSIARALLKNPTILILDEATSSLDATSEYLIQTALAKLLRGRTSLVIAHRLSTILNSDRIVVLDAGRVVEIGTHHELLDRAGLYADLFHQQFGKALQLDGERRGVGRESTRKEEQK
ncbi:MAG: ABC transporter ATP-binding protein [Candidatus Brocadiae bacterium]|nr:ABC transporter ATP-binding protein [Candidatus Brocadiia bacterium]